MHGTQDTDVSRGHGDPHDAIADLEAEIEALAAAMERCRKIGWAAKAVILCGLALISAAAFGLIWPDGFTVIIALAAIIGGIVVYGSNAGTARQTAEALRAANALRAELIDQIDLRPVSARLVDG
jgi:hypothetical protein